jgi:hypothetical protein
MGRRKVIGLIGSITHQVLGNTVTTTGLRALSGGLSNATRFISSTAQPRRLSTNPQLVYKRRLLEINNNTNSLLSTLTNSIFTNTNSINTNSFYYLSNNNNSSFSRRLFSSGSSTTVAAQKITEPNGNLTNSDSTASSAEMPEAVSSPTGGVPSPEELAKNPLLSGGFQEVDTKNPQPASIFPPFGKVKAEHVVPGIQEMLNLANKKVF